ncbi:MAG: S1-like domain-containing RNA-binding protein [Bacteroidota bacterium]
MKVGQIQELKISRITPPGAYLTDGTTDVLLPTRYIPYGAKVDEKLSVFVYRDSEGRIICTTEIPMAEVGQFAYLKVKDTNDVGAFLDWGISKDLLVPYREQKVKLRKGYWVLVYVYLDQKTDRVAATAKLGKYLSETNTLETGQQVDLLVTDTTDLGVNVIVENAHRGLIYENDLFHDLLPGDRLKGYVKQIRQDGKLDISLRKEGVENLEAGAELILKELRKADGFLPLHDKSSPDEIQSFLQMSKKNFKRSIGILYKQKRIKILDKGIALTKTQP